MNHATDGLLMAFHDGAVDGPALAELRDHLAGCDVCTRELDELRRGSAVMTDAMAALDVPAPMLRTRAALVRRRGAGAGLSWLAKAAMLLIALTGVLTAVPGTPLRRAVESMLGQTPDQPPAQPTTEPAAAPVPDVRDIRILPAEGRVRVLVHRPVAIEVTVTLSDTDHAIVERSAIGQDVAFRSGPGRVEVSGLERGSLRIVIPHSVADATVEIDGRVYVYKQDGQLHLTGVAGSGRGAEVRFRFGE